MTKKDKRTPPLACRPKVENEWLYKAVEKHRKKLKLTSTSETIEHILITSLK